VSKEAAFQLLKEGIAAAKSGRKDQTRQLLQEATRLDPNNETAWMWLAGVAESPGEALECLVRVLDINPANDRARAAFKSTRLQAGYAALKVQDKARAWALLYAAVADDPTNETAWLALSAAATSSEMAIECLQSVLEINPKNERALAGLNWYRSQQPQEAPPAWTCPLCAAGAEQARNPCPECGAILNLAEPAAFARHTAACPDRLSAAIDRLAGTPTEEATYDTYFYLGIALLNQQRFGEAHKELQAAYRLRPRERELRRFLDQLKAHLAAEEAAAREAQEKERASRKIVLVVDDSPTVRKLVGMTLERRGFRVVDAADAYQAVELIHREGVPHLILLDITMPGMDGYQLCKLLRQYRETARLPIIMLSGKDGFFSKVRGRMAGCTEYLTKPFRPAGLVKTVEKYLGRRGDQGAGVRGQQDARPRLVTRALSSPAS
jgi:twitching motility two-component system response regulator PilG